MCARTDNRGKQRLGFNDTAVRQPKPFGQEGRGVEVRDGGAYTATFLTRPLQVKSADAYEDDLEAKVPWMRGALRVLTCLAPDGQNAVSQSAHASPGRVRQSQGAATPSSSFQCVG